MEKITYLVANYNNEKYLEDCLLSLKSQTCDRWQCVICDDKSTDRSVEIIKAHAHPAIRLLGNETNIGYIKTLKRLIREAPSDIVGILDSDDALEEDATARVLEVYDNNENAGFVYSKFWVMSEDMKHKVLEAGMDNSRMCGCSALLYHLSHLKTFRKSIYYQTSGLDDGMLYAEDRDLIYKLEEVSYPIFVNKALYKYRLTSDSQSRDPAKKKIGIQNHRKAVRNALRRRKIRGWSYFFFTFRFWLIPDHCPRANQWRLLRFSMARALRAICYLDKRLNPRHNSNNGF